MSARSSLPPFKAVLFDVDGTLLDSLRPIILGLKETIQQYVGMTVSDSEILQLVGMPLRAQMALYAPDAALLPEMIEYAMDRMESHAELEFFFEPAVQTLRLFHDAGIKTALVTSKNATELALFMKRFSGADSVDVTVCSSDVLRPKPSPESAQLACTRLDVQARDAIFIGDSLYDLHCARGAEMRCAAVAYGAGIRDQLAREMPDLLFDTPEDLLAWARQTLLNTPCHEKS